VYAVCEERRCREMDLQLIDVTNIASVSVSAVVWSQSAINLERAAPGVS
jgi:hypothetical protein